MSVDMTGLNFTLDHRVSQIRPVSLEQSDSASGMVVVYLDLELPILSTLECFLAVLPHFTNRNMILKISLHVNKCTTFDELILSQQYSIIYVTKVNSTSHRRIPLKPL
jgi:hypothetical protein